MATELLSSTVCILDTHNRPVGTGFVVSGDGLIVTCAHVFGGEIPKRVPILFQLTHEQRITQVLTEWWRPPEAEDVAILQVEGDLPIGVVPVLLSSASETAGRTFTTFGFPAVGEIEGVLGTGDILGLGAKTQVGQPLLQLRSNEVTQGFSGAPVFDGTTHRVIGMVVLIATPDRSGKMSETAFATPVETLCAICPRLQPSAICPYRNLDAFTEADASFYFGRQRIVEEIVQNLRIERRFLAVFGPSGSGKSSVVQAGLIPRLRQGILPGSDQWIITVVRPTTSLFTDIVSRLQQRHRSAMTREVVIIDQFEELFTAFPEQDCKTIGSQIADVLENAPDITLILVMRNDFYSRFVQMESLAYWLKGRLINISSILKREEVVDIIREPVRAVGLRFEEGLEETIVQDVLDVSSQGGESQRVGSSTVLPLLEFALTQLWERREGGVLTHQAYSVIGGVTGGLTQWADHAFYQFSEQQRPLVQRIFTDLIHIGNEDQHVPNSRRWKPLTSLVQSETERVELLQIVQQLVADRLLVMSYDISVSEATVEIIHDALLEEWGILRRWIAEDRRFLAWNQRLEERVREWVETDPHDEAQRDKYKLFGGRDLAEAVEWQEERPASLSLKERQFIRASQERQERDAMIQRQSVRRLRFLVTALSLFSVVVILLASATGIGFYQANTERQLANARANEAKQQELIALSRALAAEANGALASKQLDLALLLAVKATKKYLNYDTGSSLVSALEYSPDIESILRGHISDMQTINGRARGVSVVTFSADGRTLVSGGYRDGQLILWDIAKKTRYYLPDTADKDGTGVAAAALSPDGRYLASTGFEGGGWLWDVQAGYTVADLDIPVSAHALAFSPDGKLLAIGECGNVTHPNPGPLNVCTAGFIQLWDVQTRRPVGPPLTGHTDEINKVAFSPDGKLLASASNDKTVRLWDVRTRQPFRAPLTGHTDDVTSVTFSRDSKMVASGSADKSIRVWNVTSGQLVVPPLTGHTDAVTGVAFDPQDDHLLVSSSLDATVRLWDPMTGYSIPDPLLGHQDGILDVAFSPDGLHIASAGLDNTVILWNVRKDNALYRLFPSPFYPDVGYGGYVGSLAAESRQEPMAFSPDGNFFASLNPFGVIYFWNVVTGQLVTQLSVDTSHNGRESNPYVMSLAFNAEGTELLSVNSDGTVTAWNTTTFQPTKLTSRSIPLEHTAAVTLSSDGRVLALGYNDGSIRLWDLEAAKPLGLPLQGHTKQILGLVFSSDNRVLASSSVDRTVRVWDVVTGQSIGPVIKPADDVGPLAVSSNGQTIATISVKSATRYPRENGTTIVYPAASKMLDSTVSLWKVATGTPLEASFSIPKEFQSLAFTLDGKYLALRGCDAFDRYFPDTCSGGQIQLWDVATQQPIAKPFYTSSYLTGMALSKDGRWLAGPAVDGTFLAVWDPSIESWQKRACNIAHRNFSLDEWKQFVSNDPYLPVICPQLPVDTALIQQKLSQALSSTGPRIKKAAYLQATEWAGQTDDARLNNDICGAGSIEQFASVVFPACERAVELEPNDGDYIDTRGLARAMKGDFPEAIDDFQYFINWAQKAGLYNDKPYFSERRAWIQMMQQGRNPFDAKTLNSIREEYIAP